MLRVKQALTTFIVIFCQALNAVEKSGKSFLSYLSSILIFRKITLVTSISFSGEVLVFVVNHNANNNWEKDTVEKFRLDIKQSSVTHLKTYSSEYFHV